MVNATTVKGLADRLTKAEQLVADGAVYPVAGCDGYAVVRNSGGDSMYLVRYTVDHENCTCPDYKQRQGKSGLPCKHLLAAQLALGSNPQSPGSASTDEPWRADGYRVDPAIGLALLTGKGRAA